MQHSALEFILHTRDETEFCLHQLAEKTYDSFISDAVLSRAIVRSLEIIGEASKHIPTDFQVKYPLIEWKVMAGMRDRLMGLSESMEFLFKFRHLMKNRYLWR